MNLYLVFVFLLVCAMAKASEVCPPGHYLVKGHFRTAYARSDGTPVSSTNVKQHCRKHNEASEYLIPALAVGAPPNWPHKTEKAGKWIEIEKERLIDAIDSLPEVLWRKIAIKFYRLLKSKYFPNPATSAEGVLVLYDSAFGGDRDLSRILAHELIHEYFRNLSPSEAQSYRRVTGWHLRLESDRKINWYGRDSGYVEDDGSNSYEEDFANNVEYFLFDKEKLQRLTPKAFQWIENHFGSDFRLKVRRKQK